VTASNPIPLGHGNGEVDMKFDNAGSLDAAHGGNGFYDKDNSAAASAGDTAFAYKTGGATAADPTYARSCYRVYCHGGDNNATYPPNWGGTAQPASTAWNATIGGAGACTPCHASAPTTARHIAHDNNNAWVPNECGSCHLANNDKTTSMDAFATHVNGSVDMAAAVPYTPPTCTNVCHLVSAASGGWTGANPLDCTDCHSGTYIGGAPTSGLHAVTRAMAHDDLFLLTPTGPETATCTHCHSTPTSVPPGPTTTHLTGSAGVAPPRQNSTETTYRFNPTYVVSYDNALYASGRTSCQANCHSDNRVVDTNPAGLAASPWKRTWIGVVDAKPGDASNDAPGTPVCKNCHGDFKLMAGWVADGWNLDTAAASTTNHVDPYSGNTGDKMSLHSVCQTCHGWGYAGYDTSWNGTAPGHGDGSISMNGPSDPGGAGAKYNNATGGCGAACHSPTFVMNTNSGWAVNYGNFGSGACESCHNGVQTQYPLAPNVMGDGVLPAGDPMHTTPLPFDDGNYGFNVNGHGRDADTSGISNGNEIKKVCIDCHDITIPSPSTHLDGVLNGRIGPPNTTNRNSFHLVAGFVSASVPASQWTIQVQFDNYCWTACHQGRTTDMRHGEDAVPVANAMELGTHNSYTVPSNTPPPFMFYDQNVSSYGPFDGAPNYGLCVTCHNPHGTNVSSPKNTGNNKMVIFRWERPAELCNKCHP
jgi:hypothetical protein